MRKTLITLTKNPLILPVYFLLFAILILGTIKIFVTGITAPLYTSQASMLLELGAVMLLLIILGFFVVEMVRKLNAHHQELVKKEKALTESKAIYKDLFDKSPMPKWVCDRETLQFYKVNDAAVKLYGYSKKEFLERSIFDIRLQEDHDNLKHHVHKADFMTTYYGPRRHLKKDGSVVWVDVAVDEIMYNGKSAILTVVNDLTEKIKAEEELRMSEELYRSLFNNNPAFIWVTEPPTLRYLDVNETAIAVFGYSREEFLSMSVFDLLLPQERDAIKSRVQTLKPPNSKFVDRHVKKNGEIIYVEVNIHMIIYKGVQAGLVIGQDVTEKIKAEEKLVYEEEFFRNITENTSDVQIITDAKGKIVYASNSITKNFGLAKEEIIGKTRNHFWHPDDLERTQKQIVQLVNDPGKAITIEVRCIDSNKKTRWCEVRITNQLHNPAINGFISNYSDITEKKIADERLKTSEELYRSLFNNSPVSVFVVDKKDLHYLEVNEMAVQTYGYTKEEFANLTVFDIRSHEHHVYLYQLMNDKNCSVSPDYHVHHKKKNGESMIVDVTLDVINYKGKEAFLAIVKDVTKTLQLQKQLNQEKVNKQVEITRATITGQEKERHELGKELHDNVNQILASAKLYLETSMAMPEKQVEFVNNGKILVNTAINEIRKISKSLVPPSLGDLTLKEALHELVDPIRVTKKRISLKLKTLDEEKLCNDLKISVYRIVQEQLNNILKYAEATEITVQMTQSEKELHLLIADNGKGFDVDKKRNGIGITNMINRASVFHGTVQIHSTPSNGCRVHVNFNLEAKNHGKFLAVA